MVAAVLQHLASESSEQTEFVHYFLPAALERCSWMEYETCSLESAADFALLLRLRFLPFYVVFSLKKTST